jgi:hypothetical protein
MNYEFHPEAEQELYEAALRYDSEVPGLGRRFAASPMKSNESYSCYWSIQNWAHTSITTCGISFLGDFPSPSCTRRRQISFTSSPSRTAAASLAIGNCESRTDNERSQATRSRQRAPR